MADEIAPYSMELSEDYLKNVESKGELEFSSDTKKPRRWLTFLLGLAVGSAGVAAYYLWHPNNPPSNPPQESPIVRNLSIDNVTYYNLLNNLTYPHIQYFNNNATLFNGNLSDGELVQDTLAIHANNSAQNIYLIETQSPLGITNFDLIFGNWVPPETVAYVEGLLGDNNDGKIPSEDQEITIRRIPIDSESENPFDYQIALDSLLPDIREGFLRNPDLDLKGLVEMTHEEQKEIVDIADIPLDESSLRRVQYKKTSLRKLFHLGSKHEQATAYEVAVAGA